MPMRHRASPFGLIPTFVLAGLFLVFSGASAEPLHLRVGTLPFLSNAILAIAAEEGYFADQNLDVELIPFNSSNDLIPLLLKGELDIATPALTAGFFNAIGRGGKLKIALPLTDFKAGDRPVVALLARSSDVRSRVYASPATWKGLKVALPPAGATAVTGYLMDLALKQGSLRLKDVNLVTVDLATQAEALKSGQVDIVYAVEPWITRMTASKDISVLYSIESLEPELLSSMIAYGKKLLDNPDAGRRFATAYFKAVRQYMKGNTPRNVEIAARYTGLDPALVARVAWSHSPADGHINIDSIMAYQAWLHEQGLLDSILDTGKFLDTRFAAEANASPGMSK